MRMALVCQQINNLPGPDRHLCTAQEAFEQSIDNEPRALGHFMLTLLNNVELHTRLAWQVTTRFTSDIYAGLLSR